LSAAGCLWAEAILKGLRMQSSAGPSRELEYPTPHIPRENTAELATLTKNSRALIADPRDCVANWRETKHTGFARDVGKANDGITPRTVAKHTITSGRVGALHARRYRDRGIAFYRRVCHQARPWP